MIRTISLLALWSCSLACGSAQGLNQATFSDRGFYSWSASRTYIVGPCSVVASFVSGRLEVSTTLGYSPSSAVNAQVVLSAPYLEWDPRTRGEVALISMAVDTELELGAAIGSTIRQGIEVVAIQGGNVYAALGGAATSPVMGTQTRLSIGPFASTDFQLLSATGSINRMPNSNPDFSINGPPIQFALTIWSSGSRVTSTLGGTATYAYSNLSLTLEFGGAANFPGSPDGLRLLSAVGLDVPRGGAGFDIKPAAEGDLISLSVEPSTSSIGLIGSPVVVGAELRASARQSAFLIPNLWIDPFTPVTGGSPPTGGLLLIDGSRSNGLGLSPLLPPAGLSLAFQIPFSSGLVGTSVTIQAMALSSSAFNGFGALSPAHEIRIR